MRVRQSVKNVGLRVGYMSVPLRYPYLLAREVSHFYAIPVLLYHKVLSSDHRDAYIPWAVPAARFHNQMEWLHRHDYRPISVREYIQYSHTRRTFPKKSVLITFDDGYANVRRVAYPILKKYAYPAVVFVACDFIGAGKGFPWDARIVSRSPEDLSPLTWTEMREMTDLVTVGSHTMSHPVLARLSRPEIHRELTESKRLIEDTLGQEVVAFSYPGGISRHGYFDDVTRQILIDAGYRVAFTSEIGRNTKGSDPFRQRRFYVHGEDSQLVFDSRLLGAYDWVRIPQCCFHLILKDPGFQGSL